MIDPRLNDKEKQDLKNKDRFNHNFYQFKTTSKSSNGLFRGKFFSLIPMEKGNFTFPRKK